MMQHTPRYTIYRSVYLTIFNFVFVYVCVEQTIPSKCVCVFIYYGFNNKF